MWWITLIIAAVLFVAFSVHINRTADCYISA